MQQIAHTQDLFYMHKALELAILAREKGEVPVGAVLIQGNQIIAQAYNTPISNNDPTAHAEINCLRQAAQILNNYRLVDTTLYVTLEPCMMCAGALIHARVTKLVFGTTDLKTGAFGGAIDVYAKNSWNHKINIVSGILSEKCSAILTGFFQERRQR